jgi:hypothetical protein
MPANRVLAVRRRSPAGKSLEKWGVIVVGSGDNPLLDYWNVGAFVGLLSKNQSKPNLTIGVRCRDGHAVGSLSTQTGTSEASAIGDSMSPQEGMFHDTGRLRQVRPSTGWLDQEQSPWTVWDASFVAVSKMYIASPLLTGLPSSGDGLAFWHTDCLLYHKYWLFRLRSFSNAPHLRC